MLNKLLFTSFVILLFTSCKAQQSASTAMQPIAFPTAEGFGKFTTGGRGGKVIIVSNLNDDGEGSFRKAVSAKEPRIIVFEVAGTIHLLSPLKINANATIAGQTAPGDGVCIADQPVSLGGDNIIVRYLRFRMGDRYQNKGKVPGSGHDDAFGGVKRKHIIIDHCSFSWSTDECFSVYGGDSTTLQWNIISEPLNYSYHFEAGDTDFERHGFGGIWGGSHLTAHHNLFAHCANRNPRFNGVRLGATQELVDYRNNVIYNWGSNNVYGGEAGMYNVVGNYYKPGPSTNKNVKSRIVNPTKTESLAFGKFFVSENYVEDNPAVSADNLLGIHMGNEPGETERKATISSSAFPTAPITYHSAMRAFDAVLKNAGASFRRDTLDQRIVTDVKNGSGRFIDVQGGYPHGTSYEMTKNAWPFLSPGQSLMDNDRDGMPDTWEKQNKLNPNDPADANITGLHSFYSNIEVYINSLLNETK